MIVLHYQNSKITFPKKTKSPAAQLKVHVPVSDYASWEKLLQIMSANKENYSLGELFLYLGSFKKFKKQFTVIKAAGGLVFKKNQCLFMVRRGKWDLPKGKVDKGEGIRQAAVREVEEECGVKARITKKLSKTHHLYLQSNQPILKQVQWYYMEMVDDSHMKPQSEENITKVKWLKATDIDEQVAQNTYPSILELLKQVSIPL